MTQPADTHDLVDELIAKSWASTRYKGKRPAKREDHVCARAAAEIARIRVLLAEAERVLSLCAGALDYVVQFGSNDAGGFDGGELADIEAAATRARATFSRIKGE